MDLQQKECNNCWSLLAIILSVSTLMICSCWSSSQTKRNVGIIRSCVSGASGRGGWAMHLSSCQIWLISIMGTTKLAPRIRAMITASTIWFLCWFKPPFTTTSKYFSLWAMSSALSCLNSLLNWMQGLNPRPSGWCRRNSCSSNLMLPVRFLMEKLLIPCCCCGCCCCIAERGSSSSVGTILLLEIIILLIIIVGEQEE